MTTPTTCSDCGSTDLFQCACCQRTVCEAERWDCRECGTDLCITCFDAWHHCEANWYGDMVQAPKVNVAACDHPVEALLHTYEWPADMDIGPSVHCAQCHGDFSLGDVRPPGVRLAFRRHQARQALVVSRERGAA